MSSLVRMSGAASIGLHALMLLASDEDRTWSTRGLSERLGVSRAHLVKVMQQLARAGLVRPIRGPKGGFVLDRPREKITLLEAYESIEGALEPQGCFLEEPLCSGKCCIMGELLQQVNGFRAELAQRTLADAGTGIRVDVATENEDVR